MQHTFFLKNNIGVTILCNITATHARSRSVVQGHGFAHCLYQHQVLNLLMHVTEKRSSVEGFMEDTVCKYLQKLKNKGKDHKPESYKVETSLF